MSDPRETSGIYPIAFSISCIEGVALCYSEPHQHAREVQIGGSRDAKSIFVSYIDILLTRPAQMAFSLCVMPLAVVLEA